MKEIAIPEKLMPLIKAFSADDQSARLLIIETAKAISKANDKSYGMNKSEPSAEEIEGIIALMQGIAPQDTIEMIYTAQLVSSHLMGLRLLSHDFKEDQILGLRLLRFSNEAMTQLQKKREGGINQSITITTTHAGQGSALLQA
jgi:hypothetical protein